MQKRKKVKLTTSSVDALLPPESGQAFVWDSEMPGFGVRLSSGGRKAFIFQFRVGGKERRMTLGAYGRITVEQARKLARVRGGEVASGIDPVEKLEAARRESTTVADLFQLWRQDRMIGPDPERPLKKSWRKDQSLYDRHLKPLARMRASDVTQAIAKRRFADVTRESGPVEANHVQRLARAMWNHAAAQEPALVESNPWKAIASNPERHREEWVKHDQLPALLAAFDSLEDQSHADLFRLCLLTGARSGNVKSMRWRDVDLSRGTWTISGAEHKNGRPVTLGLAPQALEVLASREGCHPVWVFPANSKQGHLTNAAKSWRTVCERYGKALGLDDVDLHLHDLRHTLASWLVSAGASLAMVGKALGHASMQSTNRYAHLADESVYAALSGVTESMKKDPQQGVTDK